MMTRTKIFFATGILLLLTTSLVAQENATESTVQHVSQKEIATVLIESSNSKNRALQIASLKHYEEGAIPERVSKLLKESLLEDTVLAEKIC